MGTAVGFWNTVLAPWRKSGSNASNPTQWLIDWVRGGPMTAAGVAVSPETAMRTAAVWACVRVRSEDVGKIPCILYRRLEDGGKERATDHPLYKLIRDQPTPRHTAMQWRQMMQAQMDLRGNALAVKEIDNRGLIVALWPVPWACVTVLQTSDGLDLFYQIRIPGQADRTLPAEAVVHLVGLSLDGIVGLSPISYHRETIGIAIAAQNYGAAFFGNNAQPMGGLKVPTKLSPEASGALRSSWKERHQGKHELGIFDLGMEWVQTGMANVDAQYIETRKFQNSDIWRIYRMPPHKVGDLEHATFSNIEMQSLEYVGDCLMSELVRWEQTLARDLLTEDEKAEYHFEFLVDALLRGDLKSRYEAYAIARNWGFLSVNDICDRENMNHVPNGDIYLQPLNMAEAGKPAPPTASPPPAPLPTDPSPGAAKALLDFARELVAREDASNG